MSTPLAAREVEAEILDFLPADHPHARRTRAQLARLNRLAGTPRWLARELARRARPGERRLELGAGAGALGRDLGVRLGRPGPESWGALDLAPAPPGWPEARPWIQADLTEFDDYRGWPVVFGALILHQFEDAALAALGRRLSDACRLLVFAEPARGLWPLALLEASRLAGMSGVTLLDGRTSIRAGFRGDELGRALGLGPGWHSRARIGPAGIYRWVAWRDPEGDADNLGAEETETV